MQTIYIIGGLALTFIIGYLLLLFLLNGKKDRFYFIEFLCLAFFVGIIFQTFIFFFMGSIGLSIGITNMLIVSLGLIGVFYFINSKCLSNDNSKWKLVNFKDSLKTISKNVKILLFIGLIWLFSKMIFGLIDITNVPTYQDDTFGNWNLRAKVFYETESLVLDKEDKYFLGKGFNQYPPNISLYKTYIAGLNGEFSEGAVNFPSYLFFILSLIIMFYAVYRRFESIAYAFLGVYMLVGVPFYYLHGTSPYFDLFQSAYLFISVFALGEYLLTKDKTYLNLCIIFVVLTALTKNEGLTLYFPVLVCGSLASVWIFDMLKGDSIKIKDVVKSMALLIMPMYFSIFKLSYGLGFGNGRSSVSQAPIEFSGNAFNSVIESLYNQGNYNLLYVGLIALVLIFFYKYGFNLRQNSYYHYFIIWFFGFMLLGFLLLTCIKTLHIEAVKQTGINRLFLHFIPIGVFLFLLLVQKTILNKN